jgi:hypothetical protein
MVRHARLHGVVNESVHTQSTVAAPSESEVFADAIDIGAI